MAFFKIRFQCEEAFVTNVIIGFHLGLVIPISSSNVYATLITADYILPVNVVLT